jgi:transposase
VIGSTRNLRVWACSEPTDLRKGFEGLGGLVSAALGHDPLSGDCFVFVNRSRTRAKVLLWDGTGLCIYQKRLEQGRFACLWRSARDGKKAPRPLELTMSELSLFLEGCQLIDRVKLSPARFVPRPLMDQSSM